MYRNLLIRCAALAVVALTSLVACQRGDNNSYSYKADYLPVQLVGSQKWSILDVNTGEVVVRDAFDEAPSAVVGGMFYVMTPDGLYNYYNVSDPKHPINAEPYGSVTAFGDNGLAVASRRGETLSVIDRTGKVVATLPREVSQCSMFSRGRAAFQNDMGLWGYIDEKGDTVIPARFSNANLFLHADWAVVVPDTQPSDTSALFSVIDRTGKVLFSSDINEHRVIQPVYVDGVLPVVKGDTIVCLDENGKEVANPNGDHSAVDKGGWDDFSRTAGGYFLVVKGGKMGLVDKNNKQLIAPKWDRLIDVTADRSSKLLYDLEAITDEHQLFEHKRHRAVRELVISRDAFTLMIDDSDPVVLAMIQRMADKMQRTLDTCRDAVNGRTPFEITQRRVVLRPI